MTIDALGVIAEELARIGIEYEFEEWTSSTIPPVYWIGEFTENETINEDGLHESAFTLTGFTHEKWIRLITDKEKIESLFPPIVERCYGLDNGSRLAIIFNSSFPVPDNTMDIKKIQINLNIKEWMVK